MSWISVTFEDITDIHADYAASGHLVVTAWDGGGRYEQMTDRVTLLLPPDAVHAIRATIERGRPPATEQTGHNPT